MLLYAFSLKEKIHTGYLMMVNIDMHFGHSCKFIVSYNSHFERKAPQLCLRPELRHSQVPASLSQTAQVHAPFHSSMTLQLLASAYCKADLTSPLSPGLTHPKLLGSPNLRPVRFMLLSTSALHCTGAGKAPSSSVVAFGVRMKLSSNTKSSMVLPKLPVQQHGR